MSGDAHDTARSDAAQRSDASTSAQAPATRRTGRGAEWAARLALVVGSLVLTLLGLEGALRLLSGSAPPVDAVSGEDEPFTFFGHHPRLGWDLVPGAVDRHTTGEFDVTIAINAQGLRESRLYDLLPAEGHRRVVVIGDSFTFGHGVEEPESWTARLESSWSGVDIVNLAVTGYGTDQQLLRLEQRGLVLAPDLVVLALFEGNVFRNTRSEYLGYPKPRFVLDAGTLRLVNVPVPEGRVPPRGWQLWRLVGARGVDLAEHLGWGKAWPVTEALVRRMKVSTEAAGARLVTVLIPKNRAVDGDGLRRRLHAETLALIGDLHERAGVPMLDLTPALAAASRDTSSESPYFVADGHWTAAGHAVAAEAAAPFLAAALDGADSPTARDPRESLLP
ncbi:MAG: GDSL-type esterase/lipase family protein [Acidobacteriota bacterium]